MTRGRVFDLGARFDGRCCLCRGVISTTGQWCGSTSATPAEGVRHKMAHRSCAAKAGDQAAIESIAAHPSDDVPPASDARMST